MRELSTRLPHRILAQNFSTRSIEASEDLSELASDDSESRSKIEAMTGVGNEQER
jgi:hypothetical protein